MPRAPRIDTPGLLHHVIVRGIERRDIFIDDDDRHAFVQRLSSLLEKTRTSCLAWALMSNHFHLLLRPSQVKLSTFMRRLLTGHAVYFNLRHERSGHLFQNRYKSLVCQEDEYLLQLIRYIHLNPIRVKIVSDMANLARYQWSGHSVLIGNREMRGQEVVEVLALFGKKTSEARRTYRGFVADGIVEGTRADLVGRTQEKRDGPFDPRILGGPDFVLSIQEEDQGLCLSAGRRQILMIIEQVTAELGVPARAVSGGSRLAAAVRARSAICKAALDEGHPAAEVARHLGMSGYGVSLAAKRMKDEMVGEGEKSAI